MRKPITILTLCLLFAIGIPFFLPHMHERYFYAADILSLILAFSVPLTFPAALLVQFASLLGYHAYLKMRFLLLMDRGAAALIAVLVLCAAFFASALAAPPPPPAKMPPPSCEAWLYWMLPLVMVVVPPSA